MDSGSERRSRRIVDYLNDGEELGIEGPAVTPRSSSAAAVVVARSLLPRFRWARLARLGRKGAGAVAGGKGVGKGKKVKIAAEKAEDNRPMVASVPAREAADSDVTRPPDVGAGVSLVFLLAKTSDEFTKMVKVRAEMETLLKEIKDQVRSSGDGTGDDDASKPRNLDSTVTSSCLTDGNDRATNVQSDDHATSSGAEVASSFAKSSSEDGCCVGVDVLEEEFHAELERLHVNYGSDTLPFLPEEQDAELLDDDIAEYRQGFDDDSGEIVEDEGEEDDDDDDHDAEYNGVSARELERRLHELLHQRNQERIEELEAALRRADKKLLEKEMEACLWKDTAKLALRQDDESQ